MIEHRIIKGDENQIPIIFLHGFGGGIESFELIAKDICGDEKPSGYLVNFKSIEDDVVLQLKDYVNSILELMKKYNVTKVNLVCHSFGARVGLLLASKYKWLINKIVVTGAAGIKPRFNLVKFLKIRWFKFLKLLVKIKLLKPRVLLNYGSKDYKALSPAMKQTFKNIISYNIKKDLKEIEAETLITNGDSDKETPLYMAQTLNRNIKQSKLEIFEGGGHFCYLTDSERFISLTKFWFSL